MVNGEPGDAGSQEDEIDRKLRELTAEISTASRIHEPSAAERARAAAKREKRLPRSPRRRRGERGERGRRGGLLVSSAVVIAVLAAAGAITWSHFHSSPSALDDTQPVRNGPVPSSSVSSVVSPSPYVAAGPPADPFAGTPADHWAVGVAGIVVPPARSHGEFTAAQVQAAYQDTRKILIAQNLDWPTLRGGAPTTFADLLTSQQRGDFISGLDKIGLDKQGITTSTRIWVTSFAPGTTSFVTTAVKVYGSMSAGETVSSGRTALRVQVDYLFVYAVEPPGHPDDWMRIVAHDYGDVYFAQWDDPGGLLEPWVETGISAAGGQCAMSDGYVHPAYPNGARSGVQPSGPPVNPYSTAPPSTSSTYVCRATTGT
jgi:hypothetical protein